MSQREFILDTAKMTCTQDRLDKHGNPENNFGMIAEFWSTYLSKSKDADINISAEDVAIMMVFLKIARITTGKMNSDNYIDAVAYMALAYESSEKISDSVAGTGGTGSDDVVACSLKKALEKL